MSDTEHNEAREAIEASLNIKAVYRGVRIAIMDIVRDNRFAVDGDGNITAATYETRFAPSDQIKALVDASLDGAASAPAPAPAPDPAPSNPPSPPTDFKAKAFAGKDLQWRDTEATEKVDVKIVIDDTAEALTLGDAPVGVTPIKRADGTNHPQLTVCRYKDNVVIERPWMSDAGGTLVGHLTVTVDGVVQFDHDQVKFWVRSRTAPIRGGLPQYTPTRDAMIDNLPNYGNPGPLKSGAVTDPERMGINGRGYAQYDGMGSEGGRRDIALIPGWDLPYALQGLYWQECRDANDHSAVWPTKIRDPETGMILDPTKWGGATLLNVFIDNPNVGNGRTNPIKGKTGCPYHPNGAHQTHFSVVPYLATGSDFDMEEMLSWGLFDAIEHNPSYGQYEKRIAVGPTRRVAWVTAQYGFLAKVLPDTHPHKASYRQMLKDTAAWWWDQQYAPGQPLNNMFGVWMSFAYPNNQAGGFAAAPWQNHYLAGSLDMQVKFGFAEFAAWRDFSAGFAVNSMAKMCYQMGTFYTLWLVDPAKHKAGDHVGVADLYTSWDEVKAASLKNTYASTANQLDTPCGQLQINSFAAGQMSGATGGTQSYPAMIQPAIAAGVNAGLPGAKEMYAKLMQFGGNIDYTASNENNIVPGGAAA